uniref:Putative secreted protein n=1 Tax=Anopheles marajoara TaxID=58244 RepID=A0A2M4C985_9DIPT
MDLSFAPPRLWNPLVLGWEWTCWWLLTSFASIFPPVLHPCCCCRSNHLGASSQTPSGLIWRSSARERDWISIGRGMVLRMCCRCCCALVQSAFYA